MVDLIGGTITCAIVFWIVAVPLAKLFGTYDDPIDPAAKHHPRPAPWEGRNTELGDKTPW